MESARLAEHHDVDRVAELWGHAAAELGAQRGGSQLIRTVAPPPPWSDFLDAALERPDRVLAVGAIDHVVVGFGYGEVGRIAAVAPPAWDGHGPGSSDPRPPDEHMGKIEILYVEPEARGIGVGEAIVEVLMEHFDGAGCVGVDAFALPGNRQAKAFFETHGFVTRMLVMHRRARSGGEIIAGPS
jgi:ribosomal protein S18 acetylase RimI-like enzyme